MKRILAYRFSAFGDVAMTAPVLREFLAQNPEVELVMVSKSGFSDIFTHIPRLTFEGVDLNEYKGLRGMIKLAKNLKDKYNPDYIADLHDVIRTKMLTKSFRFFGNKVFVIHKGRDEKKHLVKIQNLEKKQLKRTVERYADIFREMGFSVNLSYKFPMGQSDKKGIGIAPFAQHKGKMLPLDKCFEVAKILAQKNKIYFFGGGKKEVEILSEWEKQIPNSENLAGKLTLHQELQKIAGLELMLSMDSANMHLASLVGTRCVSIWGATHHFAGFLGYGQKEEDIVQVKDLTCRPCSVYGDKECYRGDWACLNELQVEKILEKI